MFKGNITIYPETCCDYCNEIIHNHMDCPICKRQTGTSTYCELEKENEIYSIECEVCKSKFETKQNWFDASCVWEQVLF